MQSVADTADEHVLLAVRIDEHLQRLGQLRTDRLVRKLQCDSLALGEVAVADATFHFSAKRLAQGVGHARLGRGLGGGIRIRHDLKHGNLDSGEGCLDAPASDRGLPCSTPTPPHALRARSRPYPLPLGGGFRIVSTALPPELFHGGLRISDFVVTCAFE